jgi:hypothetical protein
MADLSSAQQSVICTRENADIKSVCESRGCGLLNGPVNGLSEARHWAD